jgi:hypothetical protein
METDFTPGLMFRGRWLLVPEPASPAGRFRALFGADGVAPPRHI